MAKILLVSEETIKKYTLINDNVDGKYLLPCIQSTQDVDLDTLLGTVLNKKLQSMVQDGSIKTNSTYKTLLDEYVTPYLCWQVMSNIQISINYKMTNSGVIENQDDKKTRLSYNDSKALQAQYDRYAASYATKLTNYLQRNVQLYPEYTKCENYQYSEEPKLCDIFLEDINIPNRGYKYK